MIRKNDSLTFVLNGDWNNLYIQPDWIAKNVFEQDTIEIGVNIVGTNIGVLFKNNGVTINPTQSKVIFSAAGNDANTIGYFCKCIDNFISKATTPMISSFGLNSDFSDSGELFAASVDRMGDSVGLIECGSEIVSTSVQRTIINDGKTYNLNCSLAGSAFTMHINEHHEGAPTPIIDPDYINTFFDQCWKIIESLGYEKEASNE